MLSMSAAAPSRPSPSRPPLVGATRLVIATLVLCATAAVVTIVLDRQEIAAWQAIESGDFDYDEVEAFEDRQLRVWLSVIAIYLFAAVVFLVWIHRMNRAVRKYTQADLSYTPGWSVGWFLVPIANLFMPYKVVKELWIATEPDRPAGLFSMAGAASPIVLWWWLLWIGSGLIGSAAGSMYGRAETAAQIAAANNTALVSDLMTVGAAMLGIAVVSSLRSRLETCWRTLPENALPEARVERMR
jgi:hypothetical protein